MGTRLTYNGVTLHNVVTRDFRQEIIYDASNTDEIGSRFYLSVDGVIHNQRASSGNNLTDATVYSDPGGNVGAGRPAAFVYDALKRKLSTPRKRLEFSVDGATSGNRENMLVVIPQETQPGDAFSDIDNGPKPTKVDITSIVGQSVFRVRFEIEASIGLCSGGQQNVVLNNRWSISESMNEDFYTERRIDGTMRLAYGLLDSQGKGIPGHVHKYLIVPTLETGFKRKSLTFSVEPDGLTCVYSVVDKQVHTAAPWPATSIEVRHTESLSDGISFESQVHVKLKGPPHIDKRFLIERAVQIAENRTNFTTEPTAGEVKQQLIRAEITDLIGEESAIELMIHLRHLSDTAESFSRVLEGELGSALVLPSQKDVGEYDPKESQVSALYGYDPHGGERRPAVLWMLHCYLQTPCSGVHGIRDNSVTRTDDDEFDNAENSQTQVIEQEPGTVQTVNRDSYSEAAKTAIYQMSKMSTEYGIDDMNVAMPLSSRLSGASLRTNVVLDLSEPQAWRRVDVDVERIGTPPEIGTPRAIYTDQGQLIATRTGHKICIYPPILSQDGRNPVYRVKATTWWTLSRPLLAGERIRIGRHPYTAGLANALTLNNLYNDDLDPEPFTEAT